MQERFKNLKNTQTEVDTELFGTVTCDVIMTKCKRFHS